jgi:lysophospholipase L1-like esterase
MAARFDQEVVRHVPRAVVLWGFINDVFRTDRSDMATGLERVRESFLAMIQRSREHGIEPILATEIPVAQGTGLRTWLSGWWVWLRGLETSGAYVNRHVFDTNAWLRELAAAEGLQLLDFERVFAGRGGFRRRHFATEDGSHITEAGYAALTSYAFPVLERRLAGRGDGQDR